MMHDLDGNGHWDENEVRILFRKELDKESHSKFMWIFLFHVALQSFQNLTPVVLPHTKRNKDQQGYAQTGPCKLLKELQKYS